MNYDVLIVDDMLLNRKLMKSVLGKNLNGLNFYDAQDGCEAIEIIKDNDIDIVILDLLMPKKDGFEVLMEIKTNKYTKNIPVIINSASDDMDNIRKALDLGAYDYFLKPLTLDQMNIILPIKVKNAIKDYDQTKELIKINEQMKEKMRIANIFQHTLMNESKIFKNAEMYGKYISCIEIGGDVYDCIETKNGTWFIIADVVGHGVAAAMISSMIKGTVNSILNYINSTEEVLNYLNTIFCGMSTELCDVTFTAFVGQIKDGVLTYSNAAHPYPIVFKNNGQVKMLKQNGFLIGMSDMLDYDVNKMEIEEDDFIVTYTDGLFDNASKKLNWNDVYEYCCENKDFLIKLLNENPLEFNEKLLEAFKSEDTNLKDDVAIMTIKIK